MMKQERLESGGAGAGFCCAPPVSVTLARLSVRLRSSPARGQYQLASRSGAAALGRGRRCDAVQWPRMKVFCTEIVGGDLKSQYIMFLWLDVFIAVSQQYLMM